MESFPSSDLSLAASSYSFTSEQYLLHLEKKQARRRKVSFAVCFIALVSSIISAVVYATLWATLIAQNLKLSETGNLYVLILFFTVCSVVGLCSLFLYICHLRGAELRCGHALGLDLLLSIGFAVVLLSLIGASEEVADAKLCQRTNLHHGSCVGNNVPKIKTEFGKYIEQVCGIKFGIKQEDVKPEDWKYLTGAGHRDIPEYLQIDPVRCHATDRLKTIIFSMAGYGVELFLLALIDATLGLGNYRA